MTERRAREGETTESPRQHIYAMAPCAGASGTKGAVSQLVLMDRANQRS